MEGRRWRGGDGGRTWSLNLVEAEDDVPDAVRDVHWCVGVVPVCALWERECQSLISICLLLYAQSCVGTSGTRMYLWYVLARECDLPSIGDTVTECPDGARVRDEDGRCPDVARCVLVQRACACDVRGSSGEEGGESSGKLHRERQVRYCFRCRYMNANVKM